MFSVSAAAAAGGTAIPLVVPADVLGDAGVTLLPTNPNVDVWIPLPVDHDGSEGAGVSIIGVVSTAEWKGNTGVAKEAVELRPTPSCFSFYSFLIDSLW